MTCISIKVIHDQSNFHGAGLASYTSLFPTAQHKVRTTAVANQLLYPFLLLTSPCVPVYCYYIMHPSTLSLVTSV